MSDTKLFLDRRWIAESHEVETVLAPHRMHDAPITVDGDEIWCEARGHAHMAWHRDVSGAFHAFRGVMVTDEERLAGKGHVYRLASDDGLTWRTVGGPGIAATVICDDAEPDPQRRYKCIYQGVAVLDDAGRVIVARDEYAKLAEAAKAGQRISMGMFSAVSPDGITWQDHRAIVIDSYSDGARNWVPGADLGRNADQDGNKPEHRWWKPGEPGWSGGDNFPCLLREPESGQYVTFFRTNIDRRTWRYPQPQRRERGTGRAECTTFGEWSDHELVLRADPTWQRKMGYGAFDYYQLQVWPCANVWLGVVSVFHWGEDRVRLELVWSPDTVHWERVKPEAEIVPITAERGSPDFGGHYAAMTPQRVGDEVWMYLGASDGLHNAEYSGNARMMLAKFSPDRFAGLAAKAGLTGRTKSQPMKLSRETVTINANATDGEVRVSLLDETGKRVASAQPLTGDASNHRLCWDNDAAVRALIGRDIIVDIEWDNATLYAMHID